MSTSDPTGFGKFVPGFEFMQNLARQATGGLAQGVQQAVPHMPHLGNWVAPTFNVEDLEKRIQELKAVHFWLDQNARALSATIQALEVQKMTLSTLQGMNLSMGDVANALKVKATDAMASFAHMGEKAAAKREPATAEASTPFAGLEIPPRRGMPAAEEPPAAVPEAPTGPAQSDASATSKPGVVDPMQWWGALSQQFQTIAANAMKDAAGQAALEAGAQMATAFTQEALKTASAAVGTPSAAQAATPRKPATQQPAKPASKSARGTAVKASTPASGKVRAKPAAKRSAKVAPVKAVAPKAGPLKSSRAASGR